jgi:hypothetical protein
MKKYYLHIELCNYYLERFKKKEYFFYHLKNFINEDVREWNTKPPKNVDAICEYGWKVYSSLSDEEKKDFIYALFVMSHAVINAFRDMKLVEIKRILTTVKVNEEIFKKNYLTYDTENFRFIIHQEDGKIVGDISEYNEVMELCKYFKIPVGAVR